MLSEVLRGQLLGVSADLADEYDPFGLRVGEEHLQTVDEVGAVERVAADAHAESLPEPRLIGRSGKRL